MPLASTRTIASSGASSSGSGFSSTRTSPGAWKVTALIAAQPNGRPPASGLCEDRADPGGRSADGS